MPKNTIIPFPIQDKEAKEPQYHFYYVKEVIVTGRGCTLFHLQLLCSAPNYVAKFKTILAVSGSQLTPTGVDAASCWVWCYTC